MSKIKIVRFECLGNYHVHVEITDNLAKSVKKYPATENISVTGTHALCIHVDDEGFSFVFLPKNASAGTIAHEAWHVVYRMMRYLGSEKVDNEMVAYHLGYLVDQIEKW